MQHKCIAKREKDTKTKSIINFPEAELIPRELVKELVTASIRAMKDQAK